MLKDMKQEEEYRQRDTQGTVRNSYEGGPRQYNYRNQGTEVDLALILASTVMEKSRSLKS